MHWAGCVSERSGSDFVPNIAAWERLRWGDAQLSGGLLVREPRSLCSAAGLRERHRGARQKRTQTGSLGHLHG